MLETIREYAAERLEKSGEDVELRRRHAEHFIALTEEAEPFIREESGEWLDRLEREHDNLRAALDRLEGSGESHLVLRLAGAVWWLWSLRDHVAEGRRRLEDALRSDERPTAARARALNGAADLAVDAGDTATARLRAEEALALHRTLGDAWGAAYATLSLGFATEDSGDIARARQFFDESVRGFRELGDQHHTLLATRPLAGTSYLLGDLTPARALYEDILRWARALSDEAIEAHSLAALAMIAVDEGRVNDAVSMLKDAHSIHHDRGEYTLQTATDLCRFAYVLAFVGRPGAAARLLSRAVAQYEEVGATARPFLVHINDKTLASIRARLDEAAFAEAWEQGRALTADQAVALALDALD